MVAGIDRVLEDFDEDQREVVVEYLRRVIAAYREHLPQQG